jgi:hypothetical protein
LGRKVAAPAAALQGVSELLDRPRTIAGAGSRNCAGTPNRCLAETLMELR